MFMDLIRKRRSIRRYEDRAVEPEKVDLLLEAALRSPSSRGLNPWAFVSVTDRETLADLARCKPHGASFLKDAPLAIVVLSEPERSDVWVEDCAIATTFIHLAAASMGLGSCWIQVRNRRHGDGRWAAEHVKARLGVPEAFDVEALVAVGYPAEEKPPHAAETLSADNVHRERFGKA